MEKRAGNAKRVWRPPGLPEHVTDEDLVGFVYAVVEERIDEVFGLIVTPWPKADGEQPVFAGADQEYEIAVERADLQDAISSRTVAPPPDLKPQELIDAKQVLSEREIEVGDAFAVPSSLEVIAAASESTAPPEADTWINGIVIDLTADAREAAKLAMLRALAPPLEPKVKRRMLADARQDDKASDSEQP
jgi:hypothetical protein